MPLASESAAPAICGQCLRRPPHYHACFAPFRYAYPLDRLIHALKYRGHIACGRVLGGLMVTHLSARPHGEIPRIVIPTPLAHRRYRGRGFNQSREIGLPIARAFGLELRSDLMVRQRDTGEQAGLAQPERRRNVRNAFAVVKPLPAAHIAILDDVVTTGSTAGEMAKVLRRAGAERVEVWAVARSV